MQEMLWLGRLPRSALALGGLLEEDPQARGQPLLVLWGAAGYGSSYTATTHDWLKLYVWHGRGRLRVLLMGSRWESRLSHFLERSGIGCVVENEEERQAARPRLVG